MTHQVPLLEAIQPPRIPQRTFFERCDALRVYVLPAEVLDNTSLKDPETNKPMPSLRQQYSFKGLCFVRVLHVCAAGDLYWADVSASQNLADTWQVVITETDLTYALAWDIRLNRLAPTQIRRLMFAQARDLEPLCMHAAEPAETLLPAPIVPSVAQTPVAVNSEDLRDALAPASARSKKHQNPSHFHWSSTLDVQQWLLRAMLHTLQKQMAYAQNGATAQALQARCVLLEDILKWQHQTHQHIVHVDQGPSRQHRSVWLLTLEMPEVLLASERTAVAAA